MCRVASLLCRDLNLVEGEKIKWLGEEKKNHGPFLFPTRAHGE